MGGRKSKIPAVVIHAEWPEEEDQGATRRIRPWAQSASRLLKQDNRFEVVALFGRDGNRDGIERVLRKIQAERGLVVFYGMACECGDCLFEARCDVATPKMPAISGGNCELLANKIVYTVASHSAKCLAHHACHRGAICYMGYDGNMTVGAGDSRVEGFPESANAGLAVLVNEGGTCREAWRAILDSYGKWIREWLGRGEVLNAWGLASNRRALAQLVGDGDARLLPGDGP